jgi:hypothetical protein
MLMKMGLVVVVWVSTSAMGGLDILVAVTGGAAKQLVYRVCGASWVVVTCARGVLLDLVMYPIVSELQAVVQSGPEQGVWLSLTDILSMMWQI